MNNMTKAIIIIAIAFFFFGALSDFAKHEGCLAFCTETTTK